MSGAFEGLFEEPTQAARAGAVPFTHPVIDPHAAAAGASCAGCGLAFRSGDRCATRPVGMAGPLPLAELICLGCELGPIQQ
jgi:hypothetical protein